MNNVLENLNKLSEVYHDGDRDFDRFFMNPNGEDSLLWRHFEKSGTHEPQLNEHYVWVSDIEAALNAEVNEGADFWSVLRWDTGEHLCPVSSPDFPAEAEEFLEMPDFIGCTDETKAMLEKLVKMDALCRKLNDASDLYYGGEEESMPNYEWDALFDELTVLEDDTGVVFEESPTHKVNASGEEGGEKEEHEFPALSLAKSKKVEDLAAWAGERDVSIGWKLDGLTLVVTYDNGKLTKIVTRGNGHVGTNISYMAGHIKGIPLKIDYKGHMVVRGEALISNEDFESINAGLDEPYSNPRNLASGTLNLKKEEVEGDKAWRVNFVQLVPFTLVYLDTASEILKGSDYSGLDFNSWNDRMIFLTRLGFKPVEHEMICGSMNQDGVYQTPAEKMQDAVDRWTKKLQNGKCPYPVDGLVISYDDVAYSQTGSVTGHHATRGGFAFKWPDVAAETTLRDIEWSCATSVITPVAIFDPVELEGTTVTRASMVNISELRRLNVGKPGETRLSVIKANMIIPKVIHADRTGAVAEIPAVCPVCGAPTRINVSESGAKTLVCTNAECAAKKLMKFVRFASKEGMDIDGLSIKTLEALINAGFLKNLPDIYNLGEHADEIAAMPGMGKRSCEKLLAAIEKSKQNIPAVKFIKALSIPMIGRDAAKRIFDAIGYNGFVERLGDWKHFDDIEGIGPEKDKAIQDWFKVYENIDMFDTLRNTLDITDHPAKTASAGGKCEGLTFVITGDVHHFKNRNEFKAYVEEQGGKVAGSVSKKTDYLVNNDSESASSKNQKAKSLNIPIITEDEFVEKF